MGRFHDRMFRAGRSSAEKTEQFPNNGGKPGTVQYFNPRTFDSQTTVIEQPIVWNAFPKTLLLKFGRDRAMIEADSLWPYFPFDGFPQRLRLRNCRERPRDREYDGLDQAARRILRVARRARRLQPEKSAVSRSPPNRRSIGPRFSAARWRSTTTRISASRAIRSSPLSCIASSPASPCRRTICACTRRSLDFKRGDYNPYNKWNTTHGIVHLCCPPNSIGAEVRLGGDATILYQPKRQNTGHVAGRTDLLRAGTAA